MTKDPDAEAGQHGDDEGGEGDREEDSEIHEGNGHGR